MAQSTAEIKAKRGGKRIGAGRPIGSYSSKHLVRPIERLTAAQVLEHAGERKLWYRILNSEDDRIVLDAVKFLTVMRDGKPIQQINVTSANINIDASEIERARDIARSISASINRQLPANTDHGAETDDNPKLGLMIEQTEVTTEGETMLRRVEGEKKGGG